MNINRKLIATAAVAAILGISAGAATQPPPEVITNTVTVEKRIEVQVPVPGPTVEVPGPAYIPQSCINYMLALEGLRAQDVADYNRLRETGEATDQTENNRLLAAAQVQADQCVEAITGSTPSAPAPAGGGNVS